MVFLGDGVPTKEVKFKRDNAPLRILKPTALSSLMSSSRVSMVNKMHAGGLFGFYMTDTTVIWPHVLFAGLWEHHRGAFDKFVLGGGPSEVKKFWATMPPRPGMETKTNWRECFVPLALHGDGISVSNIRGKASKGLDCLSWTSLLSTAATKLSVFLIWFCFIHLAKKEGFSQTWPGFWKKLARSFQALFAGTWPYEDMEGRPDPRGGQLLAGGYCAILYVNRGDLDFMAGHFGFQHTSSSMPCTLCACTNLGPGQDELPWTDCNDPPVWLDSTWTDEVMGWGQ